MKRSTGIKRRIDNLGRIVIPMEIRNDLDIKKGDSLEIFIDKQAIILQKDNVSCTFCNEKKDLIEYMEQKICRKCLEELRGGKYNGKFGN